MKITSAEFILGASHVRQLPKDGVKEVAFLGRSNVGKSSLINRLLGAKGLARTSSRPGRTQSVNFYRVNEECNFVDLPGYGYARVPEEVRRQWGPMVEGFLERRRKRIALALVVVDARHEPTELDRTMRDWLVAREVPWLVAATKADKLSGNGRARAKKAMRAGLDGSPLAAPILVSAESGLGVRELWRHVDRSIESAKGQE